MDAKLKEILDGQHKIGRTVTVLSSLIWIQEALGYLPKDSISAVAEYTKASVNDVYGVATFYTHFRFEPPGKHQVEICWGPSCHIFDSKGLMKQAEEFADTKFGSTTDDKNYTLRGLECAGACALAPVGKIDGKLMGRMNAEKLGQALEKTKKTTSGGKRG